MAATAKKVLDGELVDETTAKVAEATRKTEPKEESIAPAPGAKDEFKNLPESFKDTLKGLNSTELKAKLAEIEIAQQHNAACRSADEDLKNLRKQVSAAALPYATEAKELRLKAKYVIRALSDGGDTKAEDIIKLGLVAKALNS